MALLGSKAIIGFEEFYRLVIEQDSTLENIKREAVADLINAASLHIERYLQGPVITRQFTEYYHGQAGTNTTITKWGPNHHYEFEVLDQAARLVLENRPIVISVSPARDVTVKVRETGDALDQSAAGWVTWVKDTDYVVNTDKGVLTVNPAEQEVWPYGFRNIYVSYYAGFGDQTVDSESEVVTTTVSDDIRMACKKLCQEWFRNGVAEYGAQFSEAVSTRRPFYMMAEQTPETLDDLLPKNVKALLMPYKARRGLNWMML